MTKVHRVLTGMLVASSLWVIFLFTAGNLYTASGSLISLANSRQWEAAVSTIGGGRGKVETLGAKTLVFKVKSTDLSEYTENWKMKAGVLDFKLKAPIRLNKDATRLRFWVKVSAAKPWPRPHLRFLIRDSRGFIYALDTRLIGGDGALSSGPSWQYGESYRFGDSEMGRVDPWVMMRLDKKAYYSLPQTPIDLIGLRFILTRKGKADIQFADFATLSTNTRPANYWAIEYDDAWMRRLGKAGWYPGINRFGWEGMSDIKAPFLFISDLGLSKGKYTIRWECLEANGWDVVAEGKEKINYAESFLPPDKESRLELPLLPKGVYHLRVVVIPREKGKIKEYPFLYYSIRSSRTTFPRDKKNEGKLLQFMGKTNIFDSQDDDSIRVRISSETLTGSPKDLTISYVIFSPSREKLDKKTADVQAGKSITIPLSPYLKDHVSVRLEVELRAGNRVIDRSERIFGVKVREKKGREPVPAKKSFFNKQIVRDKAAWGGSPYYSQFSQISKQLKGWLKEAKYIGYNAVELSAPWYEIEPLPGVYDFSYLDRIVAMATQRGLKVLLKISPNRKNTPAWAQGDFQENQYGLAHGLWGGSSNLVFSPSSQRYNKALRQFGQRIAYHYSNNSGVAGYTLLSLFFDHGYLDMPWLNQYVDYSDAAKEGYIEYLKKEKHYTLSKVNRLYGKNYRTWNGIKLPIPEFRFDKNKNLIPRFDPEWQDFINYKIKAIGDFRLGMLRALRKGDPDARVGLYQDPDFYLFYQKEIAVNNAFVPTGSMGNQFPYRLRPYHMRYEPIAKVARTKELVDVGMSNLLFYQPGWNAFQNFWFFKWTLANVSPAIREAEMRLKIWFRICDELQGVKPLRKVSSANPILIYSLDTLAYNFQNLFSPRLEDYLRPIKYAIDKQNLDVSFGSNLDISKTELSTAPYVIIPYVSDVLTEKNRDDIKSYVQEGGTLIMEASAGRYGVNNPKGKGLLLKKLNLPLIIKTKIDLTKTDQIADVLKSNKMFPDGTKIMFRTKEWDPPINDQPTPWIQNINRSYFKTYQPAAGNYQVIARFENGKPAVTLHTLGQGRILVFWGMIDWFASEKILPRLNQWAINGSLKEAGSHKKLLANVFTKGNNFYVIGRRFISHEIISQLTQGKGQEQIKKIGRKTLVMKVDLPEGRYRIKDILNGTDYSDSEATRLKDKGIELNLLQGEAFVLQIEKIERGK